MHQSMTTPEATQADVAPEARERDNAAAWEAVQEARATFLVDRPAEVSGPYRDDLDDFLPSASDEEWRLVQLEADRLRFQRTFSIPLDHHRHVDTGPDADFHAKQFEELLRLARATDATDVGMMLDRIAVLAEQYA